MRPTMLPPGHGFLLDGHRFPDGVPVSVARRYVQAAQLEAQAPQAVDVGAEALARLEACEAQMAAIKAEGRAKREQAKAAATREQQRLARRLDPHAFDAASLRALAR